MRTWLEQEERLRDRALVDLAIDSKSCGFDSEIESTVRYLGVDVEDALELAEAIGA